MEKLYENVIELIDEMELGEENVDRLHDAAEYFCTSGQMCEAYKGALVDCLWEQYRKFPEDQEPAQWEELKRILTATAK